MITLKSHFSHKKVMYARCYTPIPHRPRIARIATNWFLLIRGDSCGFLIFFLQSWCSSRQSWFRYDVVTNIRRNRLNSAGIAQEFITISKLTLEHAARKLRNQLRISYKCKNMPNAARMWHELTEIRDDSPRLARFSLTIVIKRPIHASGTSVPKWMFLAKQLWNWSCKLSVENSYLYS